MIFSTKILIRKNVSPCLFMIIIEINTTMKGISGLFFHNFYNVDDFKLVLSLVHICQSNFGWKIFFQIAKTLCYQNIFISAAIMRLLFNEAYGLRTTLGWFYWIGSQNFWARHFNTIQNVKWDRFAYETFASWISDETSK